MRIKLTKELCYVAGATSGVRAPERSMIGIRTSSDEVVERFVACAIALGVKPDKIMVSEKDESKGVFFYHSKLGGQIRELLREKGTLPRRSRSMALHFVAGMFDIRGRMTDRGLIVGGLDKADCLMLELLGIHTRSSRVTNPIRLISMIRKESVLAAEIRLPSAD